jgi:mono/diheme cytochrome c family protein
MEAAAMHRTPDLSIRRFSKLFTSIVFVSLPLPLCGCSASNEPSSRGPESGPWAFGAHIAAEPQEAGDPELGRHILLNGSYMSCGIPLKLFDNALAGPAVQAALGSGGDLNVPGREGRNATLPHTINAFTTADGAEVVNGNCLGCHSGHIDGELVIGMGNATADFTGGLARGSTVTSVPDDLLTQLGLTDAEKSNLDKLLRTARVFGPETVMRTVGQNPAESFTGVLLSHHDPKTLAWSEAPLKELVIRDADGKAIPEPRLTSDPPPWWRAKKKNALFYNGMARGDHRGTMALATAVCVDSVPEAERVDGLFRDMQAFIGTVIAPAYKRGIDSALASRGKTIFTSTCSGCHGTYVADAGDDASDTYPNLLIPLDVIGTDPAVANMGVVHAPEFVDWYNDSFYGQITRAAPNDPFPGYMPPPLDGVWATAPYLHNGSVPTVELVLNSKARPDVWKRVDLDDTHYDEDALGWPWEAPATSQADAPPEEQKLIYDTSYWSQSNGGHTFGDALSDDERRAVIEYLKTL